MYIDILHRPVWRLAYAERTGEHWSGGICTNRNGRTDTKRQTNGGQNTSTERMQSHSNGLNVLIGT